VRTAARYPLADAAQAHRRLEREHVLGRMGCGLAAASRHSEHRGIATATPVDCQHLRGVGSQHMTPDKNDVLYGTLGLMIIKTLEALGPLHGYLIARRIEQISGNQLAMNQGTLYPALVKLEQVGWISAKWGTSESGRQVKIYTLTRAGRRELQKQATQWQRATSIVERFLKISEDLS
jgi:PadR family transcriptional regulator, regulatory protein PadR